eukprot:SAG31_NODE_3556_length_4126_cov_1.701266_1_plen_180_part_00
MRHGHGPWRHDAIACRPGTARAAAAAAAGRQPRVTHPADELLLAEHACASDAKMLRTGSTVMNMMLSTLLLLALARALQAEVFNVYSYGAVGDGKANDTAAIQRAIDASVTAPGSNVAWIPPNGTHLLGAGIKFVGHRYVSLKYDVELFLLRYTKGENHCGTLAGWCSTSDRRPFEADR